MGGWVFHKENGANEKEQECFASIWGEGEGLGGRVRGKHALVMVAG